MIASLPMYWRQENAAAWRRMWADVQSRGHGHGHDLPALTAPEDIPEPWTGHWLRDELILSQTCSLPFRTALRQRVSYVATLDFGLDGPPGFYHSVLVAASAEAQIARLAINGRDSQSGYAAGLAPLLGGPPDSAHARTARELVVTGSHAASLRAVAEGRADAAYLDAVSFRLCQAYEPSARDVTVIGRTPATPGLPLITARGTDPAPLRALLRGVLADAPWLGDPALGGLRGMVVLEERAYLDLPIPTPPPAP